jgi:hypothetical protein
MSDLRNLLCIQEGILIFGAQYHARKLSTLLTLHLSTQAEVIWQGSNECIVPMIINFRLRARLKTPQVYTLTCGVSVP